MIDELIFLYKDRFNYDEFLEKIIPYAKDNIDFPEEDLSEDLSPKYVEDTADYTPELEEMFERMGIKKLDGKKGFRLQKDMTSIRCIISSDGDFGTEYGVSYVGVCGTIVIEPFDFDGDESALTAIH